MEKTGTERAAAPQVAPLQRRQNDSAFEQEGDFQSPMQQVANQSAQVSQLRNLQSAVNSGLRQLQKQPVASAQGTQRSANHTGLPDQLKVGIEHLSGLAMDDVKVHYNSSEPARVQARAFAQGTEIHLAPGQEQHLAHEAWHVVQQKQGRVKPTTQLQDVSINDDAALETEADVMGAKAAAGGQAQSADLPAQRKEAAQAQGGLAQPGLHGVVQRLQLVATERNEVEKDLVVMNNIAFAIEINRARGVKAEKVVSLFGDYDAQSLDWDNQEIVFVHGHGSQGYFVEDIKESEGAPDDGFLTWKRAAEVIAGKLSKGNVPSGKQLEIKMTSCHGAEGTMKGIVNDPALMSEGFQEEMAKALAAKGLEGSATAYNHPVYSWLGLGHDSYKLAEDSKMTPEAKSYSKRLHDFIEGELTRIWKIQVQKCNTYAGRIELARHLISGFRIHERFHEAVRLGVFVKNQPKTKSTPKRPVSQGIEKIEVGK